MASRTLIPPCVTIQPPGFFGAGFRMPSVFINRRHVFPHNTTKNNPAQARATRARNALPTIFLSSGWVDIMKAKTMPCFKYFVNQGCLTGIRPTRLKLLGFSAAKLSVLNVRSCPRGNHQKPFACPAASRIIVASKMSFQQLSAKLRQIRSEMPRVSSERAYAQMDLLMGRATSSPPPLQDSPKSPPLSSSASLRQNR